MARGGNREGAARKPGKALRLLELLEAKAKIDKANCIEELLDFCSRQLQEDARLMMWICDHIFGKAPQAITALTAVPSKSEAWR